MKAKKVNEEYTEFKRHSGSIQRALDIGEMKDLAAVNSYWNDKTNEEAVNKIQEELDELQYALDNQLRNWAEEAAPTVDEKNAKHPRTVANHRYQNTINNRFNSIENQLAALIDEMKKVKAPR